MKEGSTYLLINKLKYTAAETSANKKKMYIIKYYSRIT